MGEVAFTLQQTFSKKSHSIEGIKGWVNPRLVWTCWQRENSCLCWEKKKITYAPSIEMPGSLPVQQ